jgi:hypothetical protein
MLDHAFGDHDRVQLFPVKQWSSGGFVELQVKPRP